MNNLESNRRKNIRFKTRVPEVIKILFQKRNYESTPLHAIKLDENIKCISCILISPFEINDNEDIIYIEADGYNSECKIIRSQLLEDSVYKLVFKINDQH